MNDRSRRADGLQMTRHAKSVQAGDAELLFQQPGGKFVLENPVIQTRLESADAIQFRRARGREERRRPRQQNFARAQNAKLVAQANFGSRPRKFGSSKITGR